MAESNFIVGADGVDASSLVAGIQASVKEKIEKGVYQDARIARAERMNLGSLRDGETFLGFYLRCLHDAVYVDISDFPIRERRARLAPLLVRLKKAIWSLLKFYTYRMWSQQNQVNGLLVTALEGMDEKYGDHVKKLEARVAELEARLGVAAASGPKDGATP